MIHLTDIRKSTGSGSVSGGLSKVRRVLLGVLLAGTSATLAAGDLYKWQDEEGLWHFSDRPPSETEQKFDTVAMNVEPKQMVLIRNVGTRTEPGHAFFNVFHGPVEVEVSITDSANVRPEPALPARFVLAGQEEKTLVTLHAAIPRRSFSYRIGYRWVPGRPMSSLPGDLYFYPPFPSGSAFPISQGFDGNSTHTDTASEYAVDIVMPVGTPILAARDGIVMEIEDNFHGSGQNRQKYIDRANIIRVLHPDGSMALYAHLEPDSARVRAGSRVHAGQWMANSGNTGFSNGPHLHFAIQMNSGMSLDSLPFRFYDNGDGSMMPNGKGLLYGVLRKE
jgi:murein DD-endopeptidase MepM/ murein hydrolase activator NlpD